MVAVDLRHRYEEYVCPFVGDITVFDELLRSHGAIISGALALHFFVPDGAWEPHDLDIYLPSNTYHSFVRSVMGVGPFGWTRVPAVRKRHHATSARRDVYSFTGAGVDEAVDPVDEFLVADNDVDRVHGDVHGALDENPGDRHGPDSSSPPSTSSTHFVVGAAEDAMIVDDDMDSTSDGDDGELVFAAVDDDSDGGDSVFGNGVFLNSNEHHATDRQAQLTHYVPHRPAIVYGRGFRTMQSFRTPLMRRVNVVCSPSNNPITPLRHFWTTIMENFLTPDGCLCAFPSGTLDMRGATKLDPLMSRELETLAVYEERGFVFGGEELRRELDVWDYIFFGQRQLLAVDFRRNLGARRHKLPVFQTERGWVPNDGWEFEAKGEYCSSDLILC